MSASPFGSEIRGQVWVVCVFLFRCFLDFALCGDASGWVVFSGGGVVSVVLDLFLLGGAFSSRHCVSSFIEIEN